MLNVVAIMGHLARDPELRQTTTGKNVASFRIWWLGSGHAKERSKTFFGIAKAMAEQWGSL